MLGRIGQRWRLYMPIESEPAQHHRENGVGSRKFIPSREDDLLYAAYLDYVICQSVIHEHVEVQCELGSGTKTLVNAAQKRGRGRH